MCPDPIHPAYGYALDAKGRPQWLDVVVLERQGCTQPPQKTRKPLSPIQSPSSSP